MTSKLFAYLGFCARSRNVSYGYNTAIDLINKKKAKYVLITEDASANTIEKISGKCRKQGIKCDVFGKVEEMSDVAGKSGCCIYTVTDPGFAKSISSEIDRIRSEGEKINA